MRSEHEVFFDNEGTISDVESVWSVYFKRQSNNSQIKTEKSFALLHNQVIQIYHKSDSVRPLAMELSLQLRCADHLKLMVD